MKRKFASVIVLLCVAVFCAGAYNMKQGASMLKGLRTAVSLYKSDDYAKASEADNILLWVFEDQEQNAQARNYGCWGWVKGGPNKDLNMPLFATPVMWLDLWECRDRMSDAVKGEFDAALERIAVAVERRFKQEEFPIGRDRFEYTNAFCAYVESMFIISMRKEDKRLQRKAITQWGRFYKNWLFYSFSEFMSSHYDDVDFTSLMNIWRYAPNQAVKTQAKELLDDIYIAEVAATHPLLKENIVGSSRDYRERHKGGDCRAKFLINTPEDYEIPERARKLMEHRKYPFLFEGKAGTSTFTYKSYQLKDAGMGSMTGWGCYFWQNLHLVAAAGTDENNRATMFIPGVNNPVNGFTDQKEMSALIVYNRKPTLWHLSAQKSEQEVAKSIDKFGIGLSDGFTVLKEDYGELVLTAYGYDFYVWQFEVAEGELRPCLLYPTHRVGTSASKRYHNRKADFTEYLFPLNNEWTGAVVKVVKAGTKVKAPRVTYTNGKGITTFADKVNGLEVKVALTPLGASMSLPKENLDMMPRRRMNQ